MSTTGNQSSKPSARLVVLRLALVFFAIVLALGVFSIAIVDLVMLAKTANDLASLSYSRTTGTVTGS